MPTVIAIRASTTCQPIGSPPKLKKTIEIRMPNNMQYRENALRFCISFISEETIFESLAPEGDLNCLDSGLI
jgi:hypothetical protein